MISWASGYMMRILRRRSGTEAGLAGPVAAGAGDRAAAGRELTDRLVDSESVRPRIDSRYLLGFPGMIGLLTTRYRAAAVKKGSESPI